MAKTGSWAWEGRQKIQKSLDSAHRYEEREFEEFDPEDSLFRDEVDDVLEDYSLEIYMDGDPF